jgi:hypothetical protein
MKQAAGFVLPVVPALTLLVVSASAQIAPRNFGSVVFPGGTAATSPQITRNFGSVVFPGGSPTSPPVRVGPGTVVPPLARAPINNGGFFVNGSSSFSGVGNSFVGNTSSRFNTFNNFNGIRGRGNKNGGRNQSPIVFAYPVVVGGGGYGGYYDSGFYDADPPPALPYPQQMGMPVPYAYPPQQEGRPVVVQVGPDGQFTTQRQGPMQAYRPPPREADESAQPDQTHFLIAFKDHTIYSSVAYWFDGDTLHYFTNGSTHNQASVSLIDRDLTERLNREMGIDFKMPPASAK